MKKILSIGLVLALSAAAWAAPVLDGVISAGEWDGFIAIDSASDKINDTSVEMIRWGAKVDGDSLYFFCELDSNSNGPKWTDFSHPTMTGWPPAGAIWPALWIDADADGGIAPGGAADSGTFSMHKYPGHAEYLYNCADNKPDEWKINHRGIDTAAEIGLCDNWTNSLATAPGGEGPNQEVFNFWGANDTMNDISVSNDATNSAWYVSDYVLEASVTIAQLRAAVAANGETVGDGVIMGDYILVGMGVQGFIDGSVAFGYDVGTPTAIAVGDKELLEGDYNLDGVVDVIDLGILATNYGQTEKMSWTMGDANRDGAVDVIDLGQLATNYGKTAQIVTGVPGAIPEPATMSLLGVGILALIRRKK